MKKSEKKQINWMNTCVFIYISLPFLIFLAGWVKWYVSLPVILVAVIMIIRMIRNCEPVYIISWDSKAIEKSIFIVLTVALWVYFSGIGGFVYQNEDHIWRNAIFNSLVSEKWPVTGILEDHGITVTRGLTYYIGFWMPAALIGKVFGLAAGYFFQTVWAVFGILLFYFGICSIRKKVAVWPLFVFVFFSGLDIAGCYLMGYDLHTMSQTEHIEWWSGFQFTSFTSQLFWVFNQTVPIWLFTILLYLQRKNRYCIFILSLSMINSTLPFIGLLPFVLYWMFHRDYGVTFGSKKWWSAWFTDTFTLENVLGGGTIGLISFFYLSGNASGNGVYFISLNSMTCLNYIVMLIIEVLVYWGFFYHYYKKEILLYLILEWLCFCPLLEIGGEGNFGMRASIPALILMYLYLIRALEQSYQKKQFFLLGSMIAVLTLGAVTPMHELSRTVAQTNYRYEYGQSITAEAVSLEEVLLNEHESADVTESLFYRFLSK